MNCFHCGREIEFKERIGFRDRCPSCDRPAHACLNCVHYDPAFHNQCRETQADRVVDKDRPNFCEYFGPSAGSLRPQSASPADARSRLDALFKKKQ
jgi:hypothetical protein